MLKVRVWYHRDGDFVAIVNVPWWHDTYEWIADRFCPCCGIRGWISNKSELIGVGIYRLWNWLHGLAYKYEKVLYKIPVEHGCVAARAIFDNPEASCFNDDCEFCWDANGDAFSWKSDDKK